MRVRSRQFLEVGSECVTGKTHHCSSLVKGWVGSIYSPCALSATQSSSGRSMLPDYPMQLARYSLVLSKNGVGVA